MKKQSKLRDILAMLMVAGNHEAVDEAEAAIKELVLGVVPEIATIDEFAEDQDYNDGHNACRQQMIEAIEKL